MDITKNDLFEMNIIDIHDRAKSRMKTRSCRILSDFIEGNLNKEHINEWVGLQVSQIFNLRTLLKVACKNNIEKTLNIIQNSDSPKEAAKKLSEEYGYSPAIHEVIIEMPRKELLLVQDKEEEYNQLLKRREVIYSSLLLVSKICDLINE
jgi:DNA gyrase/topoisomerase IV subunit A